MSEVELNNLLPGFIVNFRGIFLVIPVYMCKNPRMIYSLYEVTELIVLTKYFADLVDLR